LKEETNTKDPSHNDKIKRGLLNNGDSNKTPEVKSESKNILILEFPDESIPIELTNKTEFYCIKVNPLYKFLSEDENISSMVIQKYESLLNKPIIRFGWMKPEDCKQFLVLTDKSFDRSIKEKIKSTNDKNVSDWLRSINLDQYKPIIYANTTELLNLIYDNIKLLVNGKAKLNENAEKVEEEDQKIEKEANIQHHEVSSKFEIVEGV
jgi:hypothetical protein